jgi:soluble lytic murein transglycosylase-like protein
MPTTLRSLSLALLIVPVFLPGQANANAVLEYVDCVDHAGANYRLRQQQLDGKFQAFFAQCVTRQEPPAAIGSSELNDGLPAATNSPVAIAFPIELGSKATSGRTRRAKAPPREIQTLINQVADEYQIDVHLLQAIVRVESGFQIGAVSPKGALGLMQVMPATARRFGVLEPKQLLTDPAMNLRVGAQYLRELLNLFERRLDLVLAAYNAGEGAVFKYRHRVPPFSETKAYVASVLKAYESTKAAATSIALRE